MAIGCVTAMLVALASRDPRAVALPHVAVLRGYMGKGAHRVASAGTSVWLQGNTPIL